MSLVRRQPVFVVCINNMLATSPRPARSDDRLRFLAVRHNGGLFPGFLPHKHSQTLISFHLV